MNGVDENVKRIKTTNIVYSQLSEEHKKIYDKADNTISNRYNFICCCGKLCTGLHERTCSKFRSAVNREFLRMVKQQ